MELRKNCVAACNVKIRNRILSGVMSDKGIQRYEFEDQAGARYGVEKPGFCEGPAASGL